MLVPSLKSQSRFPSFLKIKIFDITYKFLHSLTLLTHQTHLKQLFPYCLCSDYTGLSLILLTAPAVSLDTIALFPEPMYARHELRGWKKAQGTIGTADTLILSWLARQL